MSMNKHYIFLILVLFNFSYIECTYNLQESSVSVPQYAQAIDYFESVLSNSDDSSQRIDAQLNLIFLYINGLNDHFDKALALIDNVLGQTEDISAQWAARYALASMYARGYGVQQDLKKAIKLYEEVAAQSINITYQLYALSDLGYLYLEGKGMEQDYTKAYNIFTRVASQNNDLSAQVLAKYNLGYMYMHGLGIEQDNKKAQDLFSEIIRLHESCNNTYVVLKSQERLKELGYYDHK